MSVSRDELYKQVWAEPMTKVAERYAVSSNYLARICERLKVPRPPRGYWQQLAVGRTPSAPPLPEPDPGDELAWHRHVEPYGLRPDPPAFTPITQRASRREERPKTHPILVGVREEFEDTKPKRSFLDDGYLRPKAYALPDIQVSKDALATALKVANRLYLALEDHGHWVRLAPQAVRYGRKSVDHREHPTTRFDQYSDTSWHPSLPTLVFVGGVAVGLTLFEISEEMDAVYEDGSWIRAPRRTTEAMRRTRPWDTPSRHHLPSGRIALHAYSAYGWADWSKCWRESKAGELSGLFDEIAAELERAAPTIVKLYAETERQHEEQQRKWDAEQRKARRREAARRRREVEEKRRAHVERTMSRWQMTRDLREYVTMVQALVAEADLRITDGGPLDRQLKWALAYAEHIDPLRMIRKEIARANEREATKGAHAASAVASTARVDDDTDDPWPEDPEPVDENKYYYGNDEDEDQDQDQDQDEDQDGGGDDKESGSLEG